MDTNVEWLFDEAYKVQNEAKNKLNFISDWDVNSSNIIGYKSLLESIYSDSTNQSWKYNYAYEQFELKEQIINYLANSYSLKIEDLEFTITPSATISIFLAAQGLSELNVKRILIITPTYFATHGAFKKAGCFIYYYHLQDTQNFIINFDELESIIKKQFIDGIVLTDPVYSSGLEFSLKDYDIISSLCIKYNIYFIVDYSLGGLLWTQGENFIINNQKVSILKKCNKHLFIDTLTKRLLLNGIKISLVIGDRKVIDSMDMISDTIYGGLNVTQCLLIKKLYKTDSNILISNICKANIGKVKNNYNLVQSFLIGTGFHVENTNSGYFSTVNNDVLNINSIDTQMFALSLLKENHIVCLTKDRLSYFDENKFGFRINLNKNIEDLIFCLGECIRIDYKRFYK